MEYSPCAKYFVWPVIILGSGSGKLGLQHVDLAWSWGYNNIMGVVSVCTHLQTHLQIKALSHRHKRQKQKEYLHLSISGIWVWKTADDSMHSTAWWLQKKETQEVSSEIISVSKMVTIYSVHTMCCPRPFINGVPTTLLLLLLLLSRYSHVRLCETP